MVTKIKIMYRNHAKYICLLNLICNYKDNHFQHLHLYVIKQIMKNVNYN